MNGRMSHLEEDYGDYVTRCICTFTHDDGYMICCDECSVWQHVECMKVDPNNLPDKYLCEKCEPRPVDKKRARIIQIKKKEEMSGTDFDDDDSASVSADDSRRSGTASPASSSKRKRKQQQKTTGTLRVQELKAEARRSKREKGEKEDTTKKGKKKPKELLHQRSPSSPSDLILSGVQTLLTAASALEQQLSPVSTPSSPTPWSSNTSPWRDPYENIDVNRYTEPFRSLLSSCLSQLKQEAVVYSKEEFYGLSSNPLCLVREVAPSRKGVVSEAHIPEDEMIMEYKGRITVKQALLAEMGSSSTRLLWKHKPCPFIYQYDKMSDIHVCIDARNYGNPARFIRRSCSPNAELRHFFVNNDVHFGVYSLCHISPDEEITLSFDFPYDKCDYTVECACDQKNSCLLSSPKPLVSRTKGRKGQKGSDVLQDEDTNQSRKSLTKGRGLSTHTMDEDSNSSWTSTGSKRLRHVHSQSNVSQQVSREISDSDSDDVDIDNPKRRKSREERKTEAVWKMFEKMEASRRRKHLLSEGSHDGDSSPSLHNTPKGVVKERTSSNGRKVQLLPSRKPRLSSVSSMEFFSPEPPDTFNSPPLTPSLSTISLPDLSHSTDLASPPWSSLPKLSFEVTPYLHPKYLLADFALPRKKAILRQWEMEQCQDVITSNGNTNWMTSGFALACAKAMESQRPRSRGCLKHRWIEMYNERENNHQNIGDYMSSCEVTLHHKKRFLQKWEISRELVKSESIPSPPPTTSTHTLSNITSSTITSLSITTGSNTATTLSEVVSPSNTSTNSPIPETECVSQKVVSSDTKPVPSLKELSVSSSPLFDDFSDDDEFGDEPSTRDVTAEDKLMHYTEREQRHKKRSHSMEPITLSSTVSIMEPVTPDNSIVSDSPHIKDSDPDFDNVNIQHNISEVSDSSDCKPENVDMSISFAGQDSPVSKTGLTSSPDKSEDNPDKGEVAREELDTISMATEEAAEEKKEDSVEMELSSTPPPSPFDPQESMEVNEGEPRPLIEHDNSSPVVSSEPFFDQGRFDDEREGLKQTTSKRKMSLFEYRNRTRKPTDHVRKTAIIQDHPSPPPVPSSISSLPLPTITTALPSTSPSISFLSFSSSFLSGSSRKQNTLPSSGSPSQGGNTGVTSAVEGGGPQFEPVSPDEEDGPTLSGEETNISSRSNISVASTQSSSIPSSLPLPTSSTDNVMSSAPSPAYALPLTSTTMAPSAPFLWTGPQPKDMSHDPRRVHTQPPSELYSLHPQVPPPPPPQSAPQDIIRPHFHPPYPPMLHPPPPPPHQIMPHSAPDFMRPPRPTGSGFMPRSQVPRPPMLHPPGLGPHHASNNYY